eukprot:67674_1
MSTATFIVLSFIFATTCLSSISDLQNTANLTTPSNDISTIAPILTTHSYRSLCNNFTSCNGCMQAKDTHNLECSWIQHTHNSNITFDCIETTQCSYDEIECCSSLMCCNCLSQTNCIECGSQGLNVSCLWDHSNSKCFTPNHTCSAHEKCLSNPSLLRCEYARNGACSFYFTTTSFWTMGYAGMLIFFICLPCCLYHKCGIDWDSEFSLMSIYNQNMNHNGNVDDYDQLQPPNDGYIFKGGAHITGRCMYGSFLLFGFLFACVAIFGTVLSISCLDENY